MGVDAAPSVASSGSAAAVGPTAAATPSSPATTPTRSEKLGVGAAPSASHPEAKERLLLSEASLNDSAAVLGLLEGLPFSDTSPWRQQVEQPSSDTPPLRCTAAH